MIANYDMRRYMSSEDEEDHKATLCYDLRKEIRQTRDAFKSKEITMGLIGHYARRLLAIERKYEKAGLSLEEIQKIRRKKNGKKRLYKFGPK